MDGPSIPESAVPQEAKKTPREQFADFLKTVEIHTPAFAVLEDYTALYEAKSVPAQHEEEKIDRARNVGYIEGIIDQRSKDGLDNPGYAAMRDSLKPILAGVYNQRFQERNYGGRDPYVVSAESVAKPLRANVDAIKAAAARRQQPQG